MHDELAVRHRAITLRLAGRPVQAVCAAVGRSRCWFHKWGGRYRQAGPEGLDELTRANHHVARRIPPEPERAILAIRRRLQAHVAPTTRYSLTGAAAIRAELKALGLRLLPCERTIERVLQRHGLTAPRVRLAPLLPRQEYPGPPARASNELHQVDLVGPVYRVGACGRPDGRSIASARTSGSTGRCGPWPNGSPTPCRYRTEARRRLSRRPASPGRAAPPA
jgi:hypothetical protein